MPISKPRPTTTKTCAACGYRFISDRPDYATCVPCTKLRLDVPLTVSDHALMDAQRLITLMEERADAVVEGPSAWAQFTKDRSE